MLLRNLDPARDWHKRQMGHSGCAAGFPIPGFSFGRDLLPCRACPT